MIALPTPDNPAVIHHGDCLALLADFDPGEPVYVIVDPPFGVALASHGQWHHGPRIAGDGTHPTRGRAAKAHRPTAPSAVGQAALDLCFARKWPVLAFAAPELPWAGQWRQHLVWWKGGAVGIGGDRDTCFKYSWELIQMGQFPRVFGTRDESVLSFPMMPGDSAAHPAAKSLPLMRYLVRKLVPSGGLVLDPFAGSGTTLVAALHEGRRAVGIECDAGYCTLIRGRLDEAQACGRGGRFATGSLFADAS